MIIGNPVTKAAIIADFIAQVKNPVWTAVSADLTRWGTENTPWVTQVAAGIGGNAGTNQGHRLLGTRNSEPDPTWPAYENSAAGIQATTNVFFIMHSFALKLTRHRQANGFLRYGLGDNRVDLGFRLTCHATNNIVWFNPPNMPAPGATVLAADINAFLTSLKTSVDTIRADVNVASDIVGCHSSCHNSCHGSRGRR